MRPKEFCPVAETVNLVGKKWTLLIIYNLLTGNKRFNELKACMNGISSKTLSKELSTLVEKGIVERKVHPKPPIRVEYSLTEMGRDLEELIGGMRSWGSKWLSDGASK
jgi:DNA-binding HxlR family transcriptional regulator